MITEKLPPRKFRLNNVRLIRPKSVQVYATFAEALDAFRSFVGFSEAVRIFEKTFRV